MVYMELLLHRHRLLWWKATVRTINHSPGTVRPGGTSRVFGPGSRKQVTEQARAHMGRLREAYVEMGVQVAEGWQR